MNSYTVEFQYYKTTVEASDTDMAFMVAAVCADEVIDVEDRGELFSITLHADSGDHVFMSHAGMQILQRPADKEVTELPTSRLPSRRQAGLTLSYDNGDLYVTSFSYSASLMCASHEGELEYNGYNMNRFPLALNERQQAVVDTWMEREAEYYEKNGWATWSEVNENRTRRN